jgi:hypothetical protein
MTEFEEWIAKVEAKGEASQEGAAQGTAAWFYDRVGCCTASRFDAVIAKKKDGKPKAERENYLMELVIERLTGQPSDHWTSSAMQWGVDQEQRSRMAYEAATGAMLQAVGFIKHPTLPMVGASPDGLIDEDGGFESKSPFNSANHLYTILDGMPAEHMAQVQGGMWVTGRKWWDFQSFDPRLPEPLNRYVQRIERNDQYIVQLEQEVIAFLAEVDAMVSRLNKP